MTHDIPILPSVVKALVKNGSSFGLKISQSDVTAATLPDTMMAFYTAVWMEHFFKLTGDIVPNSGGEIHLEKQHKKSIWTEYKEEFEFRNRRHMSYQNFLNLWKNSFPHVKIRAYKQVTGKCYTCLILGFLRCRFRDDARKTPGGGPPGPGWR